VERRVDEIGAVLTCFAFRSEYFAELDAMVGTVRAHHPDWPLVIGRGPMAGFDLPTLEVESPSGKRNWSLPVPLNLDGSVHDWRKIVKMKSWWIARAWHEFGHLAGAERDDGNRDSGAHNRIIWVDADARLNGPLDIALDPEAEVIAGPWWSDPKWPGYTTIAGGFLLFQGRPGGVVESILDEWSQTCVAHIENLPDPPLVPWLDSDQEVLSIILQNRPSTNGDYSLLKLDRQKYLGIVDHDGTRLPGALVDQWMMARKMKWPEHHGREWPPPEMARRQSARE
jgi:hypothetical protein